MAGLIIWAKWAFIDGEFRRDAAIYVVESSIRETGQRRALVAKHPDATVFGGDDLLMLPGLINSHDHGRALGTASLGVPDAMLEVWLDNLDIVPRLSPKLAAQYEGLQLIGSGVTAVAHSHNPVSYETMFDEVRPTLDGYREAGVRVAMHPPLLDQNSFIYDDRESFIASLPIEYRNQARATTTVNPPSLDEYFAALDALFEGCHDPQQHWVHIQVSPVGGQWASDELTTRAMQWARAKNTRVQMHMLESPYQRRYAFRRWQKGFIQHLADIGALGEWLTLAHMVWVEDTDADLLAARGAGVAHNPSSNLRLRSGIAPIARFHRSGVRVGIGMDGQTLDDDQDYLREMRLAYTLGNRPGARALDLPSLAVFNMATRDGAGVTFGADAPLGVLVPGYLADVVLLDWERIKGDWCPPDYPSDAHLLEFVLRRANRTHVRHVIVNGEWYVRDGTHTRLDTASVSRAVREELASQPVPTPGVLGPYVRDFYAAWDAEMYIDSTIDGKDT
jgi:5-methylthioadenosine/S-adenosylhomocysteine deaminase